MTMAITDLERGAMCPNMADEGNMGVEAAPTGLVQWLDTYII